MANKKIAKLKDAVKKRKLTGLQLSNVRRIREKMKHE